MFAAACLITRERCSGALIFAPMHSLTLRRFLALALISAAAPFLHADESKSPGGNVRGVLVGDSTVASKSGWGDAFGKLLGPQAECLNQALGGRSSKSFRDEGA